METSSKANLILVNLPKIPLALKIIFKHVLRLSENSSKWDLRTELTVEIVRSFVGKSAAPKSISDSQIVSLKDPGVKGKKWISRYTIPKPEEDDIRQLLFKAI